MTLRLIIAIFALLFLSGRPLLSEEPVSTVSSETTPFTPEIHNDNIKSISLFAENPEIVTPVGIAVAPDGRVFLQENHTHKRNSNYEGPETDRILIFEDTDGDGKADKRSIFYEGHTFSTDLLFGPDGHLYVSTRWFIGRFPNAATKQKADGEPEKIVRCETEGDYPHNGVGGLAIDPANPEWLAFGFGENLGVDYTFVGSDGVKLSGGGEGGSTYRCKTDGSKLSRQSTGHWNAFGMAYDLKGDLYSTDNDPNATPPNRLLHVIPGADFGYEYRYGRSGRHPLVCWYGENPGTLGMIGALGEAACGLVPHGPAKLLSASWTDNRVDLHTLKPKGASFEATREPFISGPDDFRPVHFSYSPDGKYLYFTDWVKISYPVHGHGRIWRVEFKEPISLDPLPREIATSMTADEAIAQLGSDDPAIRTQAIQTLTQQPRAMADYGWSKQSNPVARAHYAVALKRIDPKNNTEIIPVLLKDTDPDVRFVGIKWIADEKLKEFAPQLNALLSRPTLTRRDLRAIVAALNALSGTSKKEFSSDDALVKIALDKSKPANLRGMALQGMNKHKDLTVEVLSSLTQSKNKAIQREAVHLLAIHPDPAKIETLARIANGGMDFELRADAIAGMASVAKENKDVVMRYVLTAHHTIASEGSRTLAAAGMIDRKLEPKPPVDDLAAWQDWISKAKGEANLNVGRRLFFHASLGGCYKCHRMHGRGSAVGPDLTTIRNQSGIDEKWLLEHIVNPNAEMAPYYRPQLLLTEDGQTFTGMVVGQEGQKQAYVASDGSTFFVDKNDVEERKELETSIMPNGLLDAMTANEIRDLIAYILESETPVSTSGSETVPIPNTIPKTKQKQRGNVRTVIPQSVLDGLNEKRDVTYARYGDRTLEMDIFRPKSSWGKLPAIVCIHGGGWKKGDRSKFAPMAQAMAAKGYVAATISYRLSGEAQFPAAIHDCKAAVRFLRANADELGIDSRKIGAMGLSAGGHLTALLAATNGIPELEGNGGNADFSSAVQAAVPMGVPSDAMSEQVKEASGNPEKGQNWRMFLGGSQQKQTAKYQLASVLEHLDKDDPPCWFMAGENDGEHTRADSYRKKLKDFGTDTGLTLIKDAPHAFLWKQVWFDEMIEVSTAFFDKQFK